MKQAVKDVSVVVIFYDDENMPIDFKNVVVNKEIPAGLATWSEKIMPEINTCRYVNTTYRELRKSQGMPKEGRTEIRVLGFELVE